MKIHTFFKWEPLNVKIVITNILGDIWVNKCYKTIIQSIVNEHSVTQWETYING